MTMRVYRMSGRPVNDVVGDKIGQIVVIPYPEFYYGVPRK